MAKALVLTQLTMLLLHCFTVLSSELNMVSYPPAESTHYGAPTSYPLAQAPTTTPTTTDRSQSPHYGGPTGYPPAQALTTTTRATKNRAQSPQHSGPTAYPSAQAPTTTTKHRTRSPQHGGSTGYPPVQAPTTATTENRAQSPQHGGPTVYPPAQAPTTTATKHRTESPQHGGPTGYPPAQAPATATRSLPPQQHFNKKNNPPSPAPSHSAPSRAPVQSPSQPPAPAARHLPKRRLIAVQGVVYCKPCKFHGIETLSEATPLADAVVKLHCNNTKHPLMEKARTDKNGYFMMAPKMVTSFGFHKCKVFLVSSPYTTCSHPTDLHRGRKGALLIPQKAIVPNSVQQQLPFELFTVGPFAFEPYLRCSHY